MSYLCALCGKPADQFPLRDCPLHPLVAPIVSAERGEEPLDTSPVGGKAECMDCGKPYLEFPLDLILPRSQWLEIHPAENGLLCASCIAERAAKVPGVTCAHVFLEIAPHSAPPATHQPARDVYTPPTSAPDLSALSAASSHESREDEDAMEDWLCKLAESVEEDICELTTSYRCGQSCEEHVMAYGDRVKRIETAFRQIVERLRTTRAEAGQDETKAETSGQAGAPNQAAPMVRDLPEVASSRDVGREDTTSPPTPAVDALARARATQIYVTAREADDRWHTISAGIDSVHAALADLERKKDVVCRESIDLQIRMREAAEARCQTLDADKLAWVKEFHVVADERDQLRANATMWRIAADASEQETLLATGRATEAEERCREIEIYVKELEDRTNDYDRLEGEIAQLRADLARVREETIAECNNAVLDTLEGDRNAPTWQMIPEVEAAIAALTPKGAETS